MDVGPLEKEVIMLLKYHHVNQTICASLKKDYESRDAYGKQKVRSLVNNTLQSLKSKNLVKYDDGKWELSERGWKYRNFYESLD